MRRALLLLVVLALAGCGGGDDESTDTETASAGSPTTCEEVDAPEPKDERGQTKPSSELAPGKTHELVVETNCGSFTITLDPEASPKTTASVAALAESGFYDDTTFHRIVPGFVIQGGDPTGTGTGGPGYTTVDTPKEATKYTRGVVAMAKTATEAPGTSGSQFFIVTGADIGLPPEYAVIGKVTEGQDVVNRIGQLGDPNTEQPTQVVVVSGMSNRTS